MPSDLDRKFDAVYAKVTGPGGPIQVGRDASGREIVTNLPATLPGLFDAFCKLNAETIAIIADGERLTFEQVNALADRTAKALASGFGIGKGDRVAIAMRNAPAWILTYMAVVKAGGIAVLVNGWWQTEELKHGLELTEPKLVLADSARAKRIEATGLQLQVLTLDVASPVETALAPILKRGGDATLPEVGPDDDATILFTSGSTGISKGAVSTHRAVTTGTYAFTLSLATLRGILESEGRPPRPPRILISLPLFHVTGEVPVMLNSFVVGRGMVLMPRWDAGEALRLIEQEQVTYFIGVPTMSLELMQHPDHDKYDLSTLTDIAAGGAPRPVDHVRRLREAFTGAQPAIGYGLTETNAAGTGNFWTNYAEKPGSAGRTIPLMEVAILGPDDRLLPRGEVGQIGVRSAANIRGYWRNPEATAALFSPDGFVRTGDLGYQDEDGYLFIVDRLKDIIIRGGENISAQEVEAAIYAHEAVAEVSVFGVPDERLGEVPAAVVHCETEVSRDELLVFVSERIAKFKVPAFLWVSQEPLPKLGTGKIDKVGLRERYRAEVLTRGE